MLAHDLAKELLTLPNIPVKVMPSSITVTSDHHPEHDVELSPELDATQVDFVRFEGNYILVQGE